MHRWHLLRRKIIVVLGDLPNRHDHDGQYTSLSVIFNPEA